MTRLSDSHATSTRLVEHWQQRATCAGRPEDFDLDVIGGDVTAIHAAQQACWECPSLAACEAFTLNLPRSKRPEELVQAGRIWTDSERLRERLERAEEETDIDHIRAAHVQYNRRKSCGLRIPPALQRSEYQRWRREQREAAAP